MISRLMEILFPRRCMVCGNRLSGDERIICMQCNMNMPRLNFLANPYDNTLARSFFIRTRVEKAVAFMDYMPSTDYGRLFYEFKYNGNAEAALYFGRIMAQEAMRYGFFDGIDALVPVPITARRFIERGYNQSELLADGIGEVTGLPVITYALTRLKFTESQTALSREERERNVEGAFFVADRAALEGKHLLLIDDIVTTGATTCACANMLTPIDGCRVSIYSLGRTHQ